MTAMVELILVRHAQSRPSDAIAHADWPLSALGRAQAAALVAALAEVEVDEIHSSPYRRCRDTIDPFATARGLPVRFHDGLRERLVVDRLVDDFHTIWQQSWADFDFAMPRCESSRDAQARMCAAVLDICRTTAARRVLISSHGNVLALLVNSVERAFGIEHASAIRNPDVLRMTYDGERLAWDDGFALPALDELATHFTEQPLDRR